jgi:hypothetical protein
MAKLLKLRKDTFEGRRQLIYAQSSTAVVIDTFPELFCREGIVQEYILVTGGGLENSD